MPTSKWSERRFIVGIDVKKAQRIVMVSIVVIVVITAILALGYIQPFSRVKVEVANAWHTGASIMVFVDNVTNGKTYVVPSMTQMVLGVWSVHAGTHHVTLVSDDFPNMVYNTRELSTTVHAWPYETVTAFRGLALI